MSKFHPRPGLVLLAAFWVAACFLPPAAAQLKVTATHRDLEVTVDSDAKVRSLKPPLRTDDKGKPRKLTADELKELKGTDPKVPGYALDYSDLKTGQVVRVTLSRRKASKPSDKAAAGKKGDEGSDKPSWVSVGEVTGVLTQVNRPNGNDEQQKKEQAGDPVQRLTLRVEGAVAVGKGRRQPKQGIGKVTLGKDVFVSQIVVLSEGQPGSNLSR
jgi:hypothetical protein